MTVKPNRCSVFSFKLKASTAAQTFVCQKKAILKKLKNKSCCLCQIVWTGGKGISRVHCSGPLAVARWLLLIRNQQTIRSRKLVLNFNNKTDFKLSSKFFCQETGTLASDRDGGVFISYNQLLPMSVIPFPKVAGGAN